MTTLTRTITKPNTFIFMGGDLCHHAAEIRPSKLAPHPRHVEREYPCPLPRGSCPGAAAFRALNVQLGRDLDGPTTDPAFFVDFAQAKESIEKTQAADAREDVFVIWAHHGGNNGTVDLFPNMANDWKRRGWRENVVCDFLKDLAPGAANVSCGY